MFPVTAKSAYHLRQCKEALDHFEFSADPPIIEKCTRNLLERYYHASTVITETYGSKFESVFDDFTDHFQPIVGLAESVTEIWKTQSRDYNISFSFDLGIIPPMFLVASRCRHPSMRRKAVDLMLNSSFYHGAWQDRCIQRMIEIEEENIGDPINVLENHRIRKVPADLHEGSQISSIFTMTLSMPSQCHPQGTISRSD
ncbi:hypothetical protein N7489_007273 [Penicillium chrysogenum]|jgi:hypothetical protein|uniref:Uncharacterized protein n=1 Tax=Penicillium chrysogenum TaxID=5076 RepID=A0ABQ8W689_PENCH|nr:uncharacterized protein N7489_007273 [Penicillium chrysogenum]KAJ5237182.1 hypothetical protein N7489_007273 [Penicillium chrysogenum]KAJ5256116.1 hypothetical protein N7505_011267 [Penicillium chrysogenum]KAJ5277141.1 hypothetical protein N7524_003294 [Penicillium chrysogenum]KAJ6152113.1 hypothetical protein N7497_006432 [Penicillium chrysogenum]